MVEMKKICFIIEGMKAFVLIFVMSFSLNSFGILALPNLPSKGVVQGDGSHFIDPNINYESFMGRVSDKDRTGKILKVKVENNNTKFFRAGDTVYFKVNKHNGTRSCRASVKGVEDYYFTIKVHDYSPCWPKKRYFPRGMQLNFQSKILASRILESSKFREMLILRKEGHLKQLSDINNFLWTYTQQKIKTAAEYDERINELVKEKQQAVDSLLQKKQESLVLQVELNRKLDELEESLNYYRIERKEHITDRWNLDHDQELPFGQRPQKVKRP